jgi:integrase
MADLLERYLEDHARPHKKASSIQDDEGLIRQMLRPAFGRRKVSEVTRADVDAFHKSKKGKPYRANRALALLSKAFNLAEVWGWRPDGSNPCRHVHKFREEKRERFLSQQELARLGSALAAAERGELVSPRGASVSPHAVAAIRLLIFTGARRGEILGLRWEHVNIEAGRLELPDSKTGAKFVYLPPAALQLMQELPRVDGNPHVIVGGKPGAALVNLKDPWDAIRKAVGLDDLRIHDLRHSFASVGAAGGMSLPIIGALLGHREVATTARYAHLSDDPLRSAANAIGTKISDALNADVG